MGWGIATPDRLTGPPDQRQIHPTPPGGDNGPVAIPSRTPGTDYQMPEHASRIPTGRAGAFGVIAALAKYLPAWSWGTEPGGASLPIATPRAYARAHYVRQFFPNVMGLRTFDTWGDARTAWTSNTVENEPRGARGAIPYSLKRSVMTLVGIYDNRLWNHYGPREAIQLTQAQRRTLAGVTGEMKQGRFDKLTRLPATVSYGQQTLIIDQAPSSTGRFGG